jgi:hypothetical protein
MLLKGKGRKPFLKYTQARKKEALFLGAGVTRRGRQSVNSQGEWDSGAGGLGGMA